MIPQLPINFCETFPEYSPPALFRKKTITMIGHRARLLIREVMGQSYSIYACTRANDALYSSVHVTFFGSWMQSLLKGKGKGNLIGTKCRAHGTISYKIFGKSHHLKRCGRKRWYSHCVCGHNFHARVLVLCTLPPISFFPPDKFSLFFLIEEDTMYTTVIA